MSSTVEQLINAWFGNPLLPRKQVSSVSASSGFLYSYAMPIACFNAAQSLCYVTSEAPSNTTKRHTRHVWYAATRGQTPMFQVPYLPNPVHYNPEACAEMHLANREYRAKQALTQWENVTNTRKKIPTRLLSVMAYNHSRLVFQSYCHMHKLPVEMGDYPKLPSRMPLDDKQAAIFALHGAPAEKLDSMLYVTHQ